MKRVFLFFILAAGMMIAASCTDEEVVLDPDGCPPGHESYDDGVSAGCRPSTDDRTE